MTALLGSIRKIVIFVIQSRGLQPNHGERLGTVCFRGLCQHANDPSRSGHREFQEPVPHGDSTDSQQPTCCFSQRRASNWPSTQANSRRVFSRDATTSCSDDTSPSGSRGNFALDFSPFNNSSRRKKRAAHSGRPSKRFVLVKSYAVTVLIG